MFNLGIESFIKEKKWQGRLEKSRLAFLGHQASVSQSLQHSLDLISSHTPLKISCLIGPQHGFNSTQQANMITTEDNPMGLYRSDLPMRITIRKENSKGCYLAEPLKQDTSANSISPFPIFSLYSNKNRRLTQEMLSHFDVLIVDLQDVGCRVYTYLTTLFYILEDCASASKEVWILDRPNPAGRKREGSILNKNFISFVGAAPLPMRHGLTLAEASKWYCSLKKLNIQLEIIKMQNYYPKKEPWPDGFPWVLPSPNMVDEECARSYSGTVLLEGTKVSEARGTVFPLKAFGFPEMKTKDILKSMAKIAPQWLTGCVLKEEFFQPVFDKFHNQICSAIRIYAQDPFYKEQDFHPYRLVSLFLKCLKKHHSDFDWIAPPPYEYEYEKLPIDILSGDDFLRHWIEDHSASIMELEEKLSADENLWQEQIKKHLLY